MTTLGVIPARYASSRFPGKALAEIAGKPMIQWVFEGVSASRLLDRLVIATDDVRILRAARSFGADAIMTSTEHPSGTDRVAEVARQSGDEIVVNIQGDEPLISGEVVDQAIRVLVDDASASVGTLVAPLRDPEELKDPGVVKVVVSNDHRALYFSRSPIPYVREGEMSQWVSRHRFWKHVGLYVFRREFLLEFVRLPASTLEQAERLEQLRILEYSHTIKVGYTEFVTRPVDTPEDLERMHQAHLWR